MSKLAPNFGNDDPGLSFQFSFGDIAQLVEQMTFNHWVQGSSPCVPTKNINRNAVLFFGLGKADENHVPGFDNK